MYTNTSFQINDKYSNLVFPELDLVRWSVSQQIGVSESQHCVNETNNSEKFVTNKLTHDDRTHGLDLVLVGFWSMLNILFLNFILSYQVMARGKGQSPWKNPPGINQLWTTVTINRFEINHSCESDRFKGVTWAPDSGSYIYIYIHPTHDVRRPNIFFKYGTNVSVSKSIIFW